MERTCGKLGKYILVTNKETGVANFVDFNKYPIVGRMDNSRELMLNLRLKCDAILEQWEDELSSLLRHGDDQISIADELCMGITKLCDDTQSHLEWHAEVYRDGDQQGGEEDGGDAPSRTITVGEKAALVRNHKKRMREPMEARAWDTWVPADEDVARRVKARQENKERLAANRERRRAGGDGDDDDAIRMSGVAEEGVEEMVGDDATVREGGKSKRGKKKKRKKKKKVPAEEYDVKKRPWDNFERKTTKSEL